MSRACTSRKETLGIKNQSLNWDLVYITLLSNDICVEMLASVPGLPPLCDTIARFHFAGVEHLKSTPTKLNRAIVSHNGEGLEPRLLKCRMGFLEVHPENG